MKRPVFKDAKLQEDLDRDGFVRFPLLTEKDCSRIEAHYLELGLRDEFGGGIKTTQLDSTASRKATSDILTAIIGPKLHPLLAGSFCSWASLIAKEPGSSIIRAHQDVSCSDEDNFDSVICWISVTAADEKNGGLGLIRHSHTFFSEPRCYPDYKAQTPVLKNALSLTTYLDILKTKAGDAVIFKTRAIHGSLSNYSDRTRIAIIMPLFPVMEPLLCNFLMPNGKADTLLQYTVPLEFYLAYNNQVMTSLYDEGKCIEGYPFKKIPYRLNPMTWEELEKKVIAAGHAQDPWIVEAVKAAAS